MAIEQGAQFQPHIASYGKYLVEDTGYNLIHARLHDPKKPDGLGRRIGSLSYFGGTPDLEDTSNVSGGTIYKAYVSGPFRRKGVASAMLDHARDLHPEKQIRHSRALSPDGRAWAENTP